MAFWKQLGLLLWKNFTLRIRQPLRLLIELVWPLCLFLILVAVKTRPDLQVFKPECHYDGKAMPSAGLLPFIQTYACTFDNKCHQTVTEDELRGQVDSFNRSLISILIGDIEKVLANNTQRTEIFNIIEDFENLQIIYNKIMNGTSQGEIKLGNLLVNPNKLREQIANQSINLSEESLDLLLNGSISFQKIIKNYNLSTGFFDTVARLNESALRESICQEKLLTRWFDFSDPNTANVLDEQLCNLTAVQFQELYNDFMEEYNSSYVNNELQNFYAQNIGKDPNFDLTTIETVQRLSQDITNLESFQFILDDVQRIQTDLRSGNNTNTSMSENIGLLLCGRKSFNFSSGGGNGNRNSSSPLLNTKPLEPEEKAKSEREYKDSTPFCRNLYMSFESNPVWKFLKPFILGVIPYSPDTPRVREIIKLANRTFLDVSLLINLADDWAGFSPSLYRFLNNDINGLRWFFNSSLCKGFEEGSFPPTSFRFFEGLLANLMGQNRIPKGSCARIGQFVSNDADNSAYDWRDALNNTDELMKGIKQYMQCFRLNKFVPYKDESALEDDSVEFTANNTLLAALVFDDIDEKSTHIRYKIRMNSDNVDSTKRIEDRYWRPRARDSPTFDLKYLTFGFAFLQDMVDHAIIGLQTGQEGQIGVMLQQFPYPCYINDRFVYTISRMMPLFMILSWIYTVAMIVKGVVHEKEQRLKEVMKMMGLGNAVHWIAWFINAFVMMFLTILLLLLILKGGKVLEHSDPSVIFVFLLAFTVATIMLCFFISVLFSKANLAAVCGGFIYFILYLPYTLVTRFEETMTTSEKAFASLSSCVSFGFGCSYIARYEEQGIGIQWSNMADSPLTDDGFSMQYAIGMMIIDAIIYGLLTIYVEAVFPGQYGLPRKWYFPIQRSYWCGKQYNVDAESPMETLDMGCDKEKIEREPADRNIGVGIRGLRKVYSQGKKVAVDRLSLNFYEGQITSFLGHNGAGKTTTMSILTGLFPPTEGTAYIYGKDIRTDMDEIRHSLGMCPQHNVLFDKLTVEDHIWFYARLKGQTDSQVRAEMPKMIEDVGLVNKAKERSENLSGGMKRKLSVAVAFVGGSKTVILDEPTAGVDPYARRSIWDLLLKFRSGRTIILSTHHMDEADVLGDRIAIISHGKLCCAGSSLFLKNKFGSGYYLTLVKGGIIGTKDDEYEDNYDKDDLSLGRPSTAGSIRSTVAVKPIFVEDDEGFDDMKGASSTGSTGSSKSDSPTPLDDKGLSVGRITAFIQKYVSTAELVEDNSTELCFKLPHTSVKAEFHHLFQELEKYHHELGIDSFGLSDTSLEEVFLAVAEETGVDELNDETTRNTLESAYDNGKYPRPVTRLSFRNKKKFNFLRNRSSNKIEHTELQEDIDDTASVASGTIGNKSVFADSGKAKIIGWSLILHQFYALFLKRFHHVRRSKKGFVCEIVLPAGFVCLAMVFSLILPPFEEEPPLELQPWMYTPKTGEPHLYMFYANDNPSNPLTQSLEKTLFSKPWVGNRCMKPDVYSVSGYSCQSDSETLKWTARPSLTGNLSIDSPDCDCSTGFQQCPPGAGGPTPSMTLLPTSDYLYNLTGRNISDWLVKTTNSYIKKRYAGITFGDINMMAELNSTQIVNVLDRLATAANNGQSTNISNIQFWSDLEEFTKGLLTQNVAKVWFNNKGWTASVSYMNVLNNLILRSYLPSDKDPSVYGITTINHPMTYNKEQLNEESLFSSFVDVVVAICVIFAMSFIPASFVLYLIEERVSDSKHMQFVSGINPTVYWISTFAWDLLNYLVPAFLCILIFLAFNEEAYVSAHNAPCLIALLVLYGWAIIPMMYPFARLFSIPSSAFVALSCCNVFLGTISTLATFILELLGQSDQDLEDINSILKQVFLLLPHYCLGRGLIDMAAYQLRYEVMLRFSPNAKQTNILQWDIVGRNLFCLTMLGIIFFTLNWLIEYHFFIKPKMSNDKDGSTDGIEDIDVKRERQRVLSGDADDEALVIKNISKTYTTGRKKMKAVNNLCVGVPKGQCFGLLGVNGAGKTTTFKMLTVDVPITSGSAFVCQKSVLKEKDKVRQVMGYCPQFDALDSLISGREHLEFYARVRGIEEKDVKQVADWAIKKLGLLHYADKLAGTYSGGNKRKLSTAISLIGNPQIVFLDEPTTGMDPKARRFLWNCISEIVKDGRTVILTSHSMEECEALCGRLVIMVNGKFKCIGSSQHLKNRFGDGYTIVIRISGENPDMKPIKQLIGENFSAAKLQEEHSNMVQYQLGTANLSLSRLFDILESARHEYYIEDYSVSQTTLDQVFINFAKGQTDTMDADVDDIEQSYPGGKIIYSLIEQSYPYEILQQLDEDEQSVTGSTFELIRPDTGRRSTGFPDVSIA
ncbi:phospholipid-transporting ATPase ABCA1 isoform X2 [Patella vulgata]|uniref:phospholipid-transporting ATPase ABCA1 isoform X2 n=1 Tax=Patella vulgata TaxID=6465 RepID=UPI00217F526F|nr:phospholipid-transporting ATPase ABCA1 isoform X2 [Patella vulgata]